MAPRLFTKVHNFCTELPIACGERCISTLGSESGIAALESAVALAVFLPVALAGVFLVGLLHDYNVIRASAAEALREEAFEPMKVGLEGHALIFQADTEALEREAKEVAQRAVARMSEALRVVDSASSRACYWVVRIDTESGGARGIAESRCASIGPMADQLSLEGEAQEAMSGAIGTPTFEKGEGPRYFGSTVLVGVKAGGSVPDAGLGLTPTKLEFGSISFLRQEMKL